MFKQVQSFISEYKSIAANTITMESSLALDLGLTSYDIIEICAYLEDMFQIEISDEVLSDLFTVGDLVNYVESFCYGKSDNGDS